MMSDPAKILRWLFYKAFLPICCLQAAAQSGIPAFPGAQGAAATITGGRGGVVYHVTRLDRNFSDNVPGTLRYGLNDGNFPPGTPRTIVFDVAGVFWLGRYGAERGHHNGWDSQDRYNVGSHVTVAGQTGPGPVIIMGGVTKAGKTNVILRNITFAPGYGMRSFERPDENPPVLPTPGDFPDSYVYDALDISGQGIMIDHCTAVYATDETISCNELAQSLTLQYCNISQGQNYPQADAENPGVYTGHALGSLLQAGSDAKISVLHNLYAHQKGRLPRVGSEVGTGAFNDFRNNVFYNWFDTAGTGASGQPSFNNFINNFYLAGPGGDDVSGPYIIPAGGGTGIFDGKGRPYTLVYPAGNLKDTNKDGDPGNPVDADGSFGSISVQTAAYDIHLGCTLDATAAFTNVLRHVGARWWERNKDFTRATTNAITTNNVATRVDQRLIHETFAGTGKIMAWADDPFDSSLGEGLEWRLLLQLRADTNSGVAPFNHPPDRDVDGDGMPGEWEREHGLDPNVANHNGDFDADGYTDLEEYLNDIAAWPAPGRILFTGKKNTRYAEIMNWQVAGVPVTVSGIGTLPTASPWQPSRHDTATISNATVTVDAAGQHAGTLALTDGAALTLTNGWLRVADTVDIGDSGAASLTLAAGQLCTKTLTKGPDGVFNFNGGTLSAEVVEFDLLNAGGTLAPGAGPGTTQVHGNLTLQPGSALEFELGHSTPNGSDHITVNGNLQLGGTLRVLPLPGFGTGNYTLITYTGTLSGSLEPAAMPAGYSALLDTSTPGQVQLVVVQSPVFENVIMTFGGLAMSGRGPSNHPFHLLASPDLSLSPSLWAPVETNAFDAQGTFNLTNITNTSNTQLFYRIRLP